MIAISIMIHISNLGALGYSVLQKETCCYCAAQNRRHVKVPLNDMPYSIVKTKQLEHLLTLCCSQALLCLLTSQVHLQCSPSKVKTEEHTESTKPSLRV